MSLASSKTHMFAIAIRAVMQSIEDVMNRDAIPRLVDANGWPMTAAPTFKFADIESDDSGELLAGLSAAAGSGLITPTDATEAYLRARLGMPALGEVSDAQAEDALAKRDEIDTKVRQLETQEALRKSVVIPYDRMPMAA